MRGDRGSATIWILGLSIVLLLFGGLSLDFWRGLMVQRQLAAVADSAALAGASGIDEEIYRSSGILILDDVRVVGLVDEAIGWQGVDLVDVEVVVDPDLVSVTLEAELQPLLLGVFVDDDSPFVIRASAAAQPVLIP